MTTDKEQLDGFGYGCNNLTCRNRQEIESLENLYKHLYDKLHEEDLQDSQIMYEIHNYIEEKKAGAR